MKSRIILFIAIALLLILIALVLLMWKYTDNKSIQLTTYQISNRKIPAEFDGFRIVQVADLHNTEFGEKNAALLSALRESDPDIIVFTGDQVDTRRTRTDVVVEFAKEAVKIAPCYLVTGNHEGSIPGISQLNTDLRAAGVIVLENEVLQLQQGDASMNLIGLADPTMSDRFLRMGQDGATDATLSELIWDSQKYSILLAHHPEHLDIYSKHTVDLAFCGHAHGGQIRIKNCGIIAPHQGLFPKYDAGQYTMEDTTMILSRGLGNSRFPWRVNNPPELVVVELSAQ